MLGGLGGTGWYGTGKQTSSQPVPPGLPSMETGAYGTEKLLLKTQVSEHFA